MNLGSVYRSVAKVAGTVLQGAGRDAAYVEFGSTGYDTRSGKVERTETAYPVKALLEPIATRLVDGTSVQMGDQWALIAAESLPVVPSTGGALRVGGVDWQIVAVQPLNPGGVALTYRLQVRR